MIGRSCRALAIFAFSSTFAVIPASGRQEAPASPQPSANPAPQISRGQAAPSSAPALETSEDYNNRLAQLDRALAGSAGVAADDYRIGPGDLLGISVFGAPDLGANARVSSSGTIYLPLVGAVQAGGLAPHELELVIQELLRRTYMKDPHVTVFVQEMESHAVSVFGAVRKPGVFQIRGTKTLVEVLSMAEGLADDAGDTVLVMHAAEPTPAKPASAGEGDASGIAPGRGPNAEPGGVQDPAGDPVTQTPGEAESVSLKSLLESGDPRFNVPVRPGDVVTVTRAGIVYVVGEVQKPGGFALKSNENISVLQAIALAQGMTRTSAASKARIIRTDPQTGQRREIPVNLKRVLKGKTPDPMLQARDVVFVPNSTGRSALYRGLEAAISMGTGVVVYRPY